MRASPSVALMGEISRFRVDVDAASRHTTTEGERERGKEGEADITTPPSNESRTACLDGGRVSCEGMWQDPMSHISPYSSSVTLKLSSSTELK